MSSMLGNIRIADMSTEQFAEFKAEMRSLLTRQQWLPPEAFAVAWEPEPAQEKPARPLGFRAIELEE